MKNINRIKLSIFSLFLAAFFILPALDNTQENSVSSPILDKQSYLVNAEDGFADNPTYEEIIENNSHLHPQWNHNVMNIGQAWADGYTGEGINIAILDTGFFESHPDLSMAAGDSVFSDDPWSNDHSGHGTHIAGIIGAQTGTTYQGIAPGANLLGIKVYHENDIDEEGYVSTNTSSVAQGIRLAVNMGADIIVISSGLTYHDVELYDEIQAAYAEDVMIIAASGNGNTSVNYPANYSEVVAVTAIDERLDPALDIIHGQENDFAAPGVNIGGLSIPDSAYSYPYIFMSGSSQAAPHAAGLAAIFMQKYNVRGEEAREIMREQAESIGDPGLFGNGLLRYASDEELAENDEPEEVPVEIEEPEEIIPEPSESEADAEGQIVRKPTSSRAADDDADGSLAYHQTEALPAEEGAIVSDETLLLVENGGTLEVWLDTFNQLTLNESQVGEIRERNITLILAQENVTWTIPPANLLPGEAILRIYEGVPSGIQEPIDIKVPVYNTSIDQEDVQRISYPSWMDIRIDLSQTDVEDPHQLDTYYWNTEEESWLPTQSMVDEQQSIIISTRHTSAFGVFYPDEMTPPTDAIEEENEDLDEEVETEASDLFGIPTSMAIGLFIVVLLLVIVGIYLRQNSKRK